jgi:hypothetical protein
MSQHNPSSPQVQRILILIDTLAKLENHSATAHYHDRALTNLHGWASAAAKVPKAEGLVVHVLPGDWGDVTLSMTRRYGQIFASLNMANAYSPGGHYTHGLSAQEENMFRRTDCHFSLDKNELDQNLRYNPAQTSLLNAEGNRVYLDSTCPRVCIRGAEDRAATNLGYHFLPDEDLFLFFELRSAAVDLSDGRAFDRAETTKRVAAQLDTLIEAGVRHVVLSAFGCGAFCNPAKDVAEIYKEELQKRAEHFSVVAFGIFDAGYGPSNFEPFKQVFGELAA